jgi:transposase
VDLTEEQWAVLQPLFPEKETIQQGVRGRPYRDPRDVLYGVLWILRTGAPWKDLPPRYPPYQTCHRRFQGWVRDGTLEKLLRTLAEHLRRRGKLDLTEAFIDGTHAGAKRGALWLGELDAASRPRSWSFQTALVFLSPQGLRVVREMSKNSSSKPSTPALRKRSRDS